MKNQLYLFFNGRKKQNIIPAVCGIIILAIFFLASCEISDTDEGPALEDFDSGPVILSIIPDMGPPGISVTIIGTDFSPDSLGNLVLFNGVEATVNTATDTTLQVTVPDGATTGPVEVVARDQAAVGPVFTVTTWGDLQTIVSTTGPDPDPDGYTITVNGSDSQPTAVNDTLFFEDVSEGSHDVELTGAADNCSVSGNNPRMVDIVAGDTTTTVFDVICEDIIKNQIAFHSDRDGNQEIYLMDIDGSGLVQLTNNTDSDRFPTISPDGSKIAFSSDRDGNDEIFFMDADSSNVIQVTSTTGVDNLEPSWSPDGQQLVFTVFDGGTKTETQNFEIFIVNTDGSGLTNLTNNSANDFGPKWSPDGSQIAFNSDRDGDQEIYLMNPDGSGLVQLTDNANSDQEPAWSLDGSRLAFFTDRDQDLEIYLMNADGTNQTRLTNSAGIDGLAAWSPDGTQIAFHSERDGNAEIYRMNIDGTGITRLTTNGAVDSYPDWSPLD